MLSENTIDIKTHLAQSPIAFTPTVIITGKCKMMVTIMALRKCKIFNQKKKLDYLHLTVLPNKKLIHVREIFLKQNMNQNNFAVILMTTIFQPHGVIGYHKN